MCETGIMFPQAVHFLSVTLCNGKEFWTQFGQRRIKQYEITRIKLFDITKKKETAGDSHRHTKLLPVTYRQCNVVKVWTTAALQDCDTSVRHCHNYAEYSNSAISWVFHTEKKTKQVSWNVFCTMSKHISDGFVFNIHFLCTVQG